MSRLRKLEIPMKFARLGAFEAEKPAVMVSETEAVFVDHLIKDWNRSELENGAIAKVQAADLSALPKVKVADYRIGSQSPDQQRLFASVLTMPNMLKNLE